MPSQRFVRVHAAPPTREALHSALAAIAEEQDVPTAFDPAVLAAAERAAAAPRLPELDRTDLPFVTIDPAGSTDLDQAVHIARDGEGYVVHYAIADVAAFVAPGDPVDLEAHRRGETLYGGDARLPLHPPVLSEGAASLLADQVRPALLWTLRLGPDGERHDAGVERARVRSVRQYSYDEAQAEIDAGTAPETLRLLAEVGPLRQAREAARGGVSLPLPEQEVHIEGDRVGLVFRSLLPVEQWNAQISLLTGFAAAAIMVYGRVGLLRTVPDPDPPDVARLRRTAKGLGVAWPAEQLYPDFVRTLDPAVPAHAAVLVACTRLLRGSGYAAFDGELPAQPRHSALAAEYAHVTAPLRRLGDRYAGEVCLALCAGTPVPGWVHAALPDLPAELAASSRRAHAYERAVLDVVETLLLEGRVGEEFDGVVTDADGAGRRGSVTLADPAVEAVVESTGSAPLPVGEPLRVRLLEADPAARRVRFGWAG